MKAIFFKMHLFYLLIGITWLCAEAQEKKPNVLFIICDDLNDYVGVFGGHKQALTPNIDKLAASGIRFFNAQTNVPVCSPSRNSLFTGVYPHDSKDFGWTSHTKQVVLKNNKTMMRYFQENGYVTLGSGKLTHESASNDWNQWGMDLANNYGPFYFNGKDKTANLSVPAPFNSIGPVDGSFGRLSDAGITTGNTGEKGWVYGWKNEPMRYSNDNDRDLLQDERHAQWAVKKLKELENSQNNQPFFMGIGFVRPHTPLHAPDKYFDLFPLDKIELDNWLTDDEKDTFYMKNIGDKDSNKNPDKDVEDKGIKFYKTLLESYGGDREVALKHFLQAYLACVAFVDDQVGVIMDELNNSKFKDNTIVVFTSDHGWQMGEKSYLFKNSPWEESIRIPLIIRFSGAKAGGGEVNHPVSLIDIFPTLIDLADLKGSTKKNNGGGDLGGYSLRPFLENPDTKKWKGPNGALTIVGNFGNSIPIEKQNYSYRTLDWRYIRYSDGNEELYNHRKDKYEWNNVAADKKNNKIKNQLEKEMNQIIGIK